MKKIIKILYLIGLGLCTSLHAANIKKVAIMRLLYLDGNDGKNDGIHIIGASENMKALLKQTKPGENANITRIDVIGIHNNGILIIDIDSIKEEKIPTYTIEELEEFHKTKYNANDAKLPVKFLFTSDGWKNRKVWVFNKRKNKWNSMSFQQYSSTKWKQKMIWSIMLLLLLMLLVAVFYIIIRRKKKV